MRTQSRKMEIREAHIQRVTTKTYGAQCARSRRPGGSRDGLARRRHWDRGCLRGVPRRARQDRPARRTDGGPPDRAPRPAFVRVASRGRSRWTPRPRRLRRKRGRARRANARGRISTTRARVPRASRRERWCWAGCSARWRGGRRTSTRCVFLARDRDGSARRAARRAWPRPLGTTTLTTPDPHPPSHPPGPRSSTCKCTTRTTSSPARRRSRSCGSAETRPPPRRCARARYDPPPGRAPFAGALGPAPAPEAAPTFPPSR